ncbi:MULTISPECIES: restriction endonuclease subunit S [Niallia]|uniref:Restriction endonuclease subunit S n=1 Tax=Niallia hominis TaxID=3133173 RepID=A0ABV1F0D7_9BACI|nr:restriction endonuclease subunit S [Niallia circulans]MCF2650052.1 restriction endonuclease subunit S [Niallia circulans]
MNSFSQNWTVKSLEELNINIIDGDRGKNYPKKDELTSTGYCPFLNNKNLIGDKISLNDCEFISKERDSLLRKGRIQVNDIIITTRGTVGNVGFFHNKLDYDFARINSGMVILRNADSDILTQYLYHLLKSPLLKEQYKSLTSGSAQPQLPIRDLKKVKLIIPPKVIQEKIVNIIDSIESKIELNHAMNNTLEHMAMTLYKHWFIDFGPFQDGDFTDTELGEIPKGWEVKSLKDIASILMGQSPKSEFYNQEGEGLPFHQGVANFGIRFPINITHSTKLLRVAEEGDLLISVRAPVGRLNIAHTKMVIGRGLSAISSKTNNPSFLLYTLKTLFSEEDKYGSGTIFNSINKGELENLKVIVPVETIINEYESRVSVYESLIKTNHEQILSLTDTRDYLLPRLLSAEIDLSEVAEKVKEVILNEQPEPSV